jgi:hypothetical protein
VSVATIVQAARDAGFRGRPEQWVALVVLVETDAGGQPGRVGEFTARAGDYPTGWSPTEIARHTPRIALRTPAVAAELVRQGITAAGGVVDAAVGAVAEPVVEALRLPIRVLAWLTDPGTQVRIAKILVGTGLILVGLFVAARPALQGAGRAAGAVIAASPQARTGKIAAAGAAASKGRS